ncbi:MAG TPA: iron-containing alcohol dehydrogenase [Chloroflexota bacterium]|nr:iron-containing alcohol dehydrogenase [Chloroflexota bacterium]
MSESERGSFRYTNPAVIHYGPGCVAARLDAELERLGVRRAFLVTTRSVAANPALAGALAARLGARLVGQYGEISAHAPAGEVAAAADAARRAQPDVLLSLGGGSPIDAAKTVAFALATGLDVTQPDAHVQARRLRLAGQPVLPHLAIPTTLSGAEFSGAAGYSAADTHEKVGPSNPALLPAAVFLDAALAVHTPRDLWLSTGIRAVDHAVEGILSRYNSAYSETLALEALRRLRAALPASAAAPDDLAARTECQLGTWFSMTLPVPSARGLSHVLGKRLGSVHGIPHGVTSCLLLPHVMRYLAPKTAARQARIAAALGADTRGLSEAAAAARAADAVADLIAALGQPHHLAAYGLSEDDLRAAVEPVAADSGYPLDDLLAILHAAA